MEIIDFHIHLVRRELLNPTTLPQLEFDPVISLFLPEPVCLPLLSAILLVVEEYTLAYTLSSALP